MLEIIIDFIDFYKLSRINRFLRKFKIYTIIDVGAHKGDFIKYSLKYLKPKKIYAFEPQKEISFILKKRLKKKNFYKCHELLLKSNFIHFKIFFFPLMHFEDRLYVKKELI